MYGLIFGYGEEVVIVLYGWFDNVYSYIFML